MFHLLLIDVAVCAALIVVAALVMVGRWRRRRRRRSMADGQRRMAAAGRVGRGPTPPAVVPGLGTNGMQPPPGPGAPPEPAHAARPERDALPVRDGRPERAEQPELARQTTEAAHPRPSGNGLGPAPEQDDTAGAGTSGERIGSYYDEADRRMSDYLAALGWGEEPGTRDPQ
jgi:hypothetical protein